MVEWNETVDGDFQDYELIIGVGDAMHLVTTGGLVVDFPDNSRHGLIILMDPDKNIREPDHDNSNAPRSEHYYQKIGGLKPDKLRQIGNLTDEGSMRWGSFLSDYQYDVKFDESAREYLKKVYEDKYA